MEFLKNIFGDKALTYADFTAAIEADKNIKLVNLKEDGYVAKDKLMLSALASIDMTPLNESLERLNTALAPYKTFIFEGLQFLWEEILLPLADWTITELLPHFIDLVSAALEALTPVLEALKPILKWIWDEILKPLVEAIGEDIIDFLEFLTDVLTDFSDWAKDNPEDVQIMFTYILTFLAGLWVYNTSKKIINFLTKLITKFGSLKLTVGGVASAIAILALGIIYLAQNWDKLNPAQRTITILGSLTAALIAAAVAIALFHTSWTVGVAAAAIVAGIGLLAGTYLFKKANQNGATTTLDTSTGSAKSSISQYAKYATMDSPIPKLATGAVLPGGSPMLAWVNDQPKGVGYIEGSVENIAAAFEKYLGNHDFGGKQNVTIEAKGNWAQFIKWMNLQIKQENNRATIWG